MRPERAIHILVLGLILFASLKVWDSDSSRKILIASDGKGYYAYLPAIFIYNDLSFNFIDDYEAKYYPGQPPVQFYLETESGRVNKYYCGVALLMLPFFLIAHLLSIIGGLDTGGYSAIYQIAIALGTLTYLYLGLLILSSFMKKLGLKSWAITASLLLIALGTNLFYYATIEVSMSHVYSFFGVSLFMLATQSAAKQKRVTIAMAMSFGLILLIRPTNVLAIMLLPFLAGSWGSFSIWIQAVFKQFGKAIIPILLGVSVIGIQLLIYKIQTGNWIVFSYGGEGFDFSDPELFNVLLSFRKGWFIYTPLAFVAMFGMVRLFRQNNAMGTSVSAYLIASTYLISSWWDWSYGGSFGHRAFIDTYPIIAVLLGVLLSAQSTWLVIGVSALSFGVFMPLNLIQTFQYRTGILPMDGTTESWYKTVFLKSDMYLVGQFDRLNAPKQVILEARCFQHNMEEIKGWGNETQLTREMAHHGSGSAYMGENETYGVTFNSTLENLAVDSANSITFKGWVNSEGTGTKALIVLNVADSAGNSIAWEAYPIVVQVNRSDEWIFVENTWLIPLISDAGTVISTYLMKEGGPSLYYDDMEICLGITE
ncbi:MAG: hypothetical protein ACI97X_000874 [Oceanospirillaceae bacterium]|jgi:hypothetical protein